MRCPIQGAPSYQKHRFQVQDLCLRIHWAVEIDMVNSIPDSWNKLIQQMAIQAPIGEWVGKFDFVSKNVVPQVFFRNNMLFCSILNECLFAPFSPPCLKCFNVPLLPHILIMVEPKTLNSDMIEVRWLGCLELANLIGGKRRNLLTSTWRNYSIHIDLQRLKWASGESFLSYTWVRVTIFCNIRTLPLNHPLNGTECLISFHLSSNWDKFGIN